MRYRTHLPSRLLSGCLFLALGWVLAQANPFAVAQPAGGKAPATANDIEKNVVAYVNNVPITRQELGEELISRKGKVQLQLLINRKIIEQAAEKAGITVTDAEVEADLKEFIKASGCSSAQDFEKNVLNKGRSSKDLSYTTVFEYKEDVSRPAILMRKLGGKRVEFTEEELMKGFEAKYGTKVQCYIIVEKDKRRADNLYTEILAAAGRSEPNAMFAEFMRRAKTQANSTLAAAGGLIQVSHHGAYKKMEERAFQMRDNEMSEVIETPEGWIILFREKLLPAQAGKKFENEKESLRKEFAENKLRVEVPKLFNEIKKNAVVRDFLNKKYDIMDAVEEVSSVVPKK